ncbi:(d)CMP kinase [Desulfuromonas acetoxidans]|uniref:(d)CMP kinase n=1 Tax=Desulfuromonas acetoxidans TaxID=891 RepID=UPI00292DE0FD|nr:(d)CMP kinase [Desulfuromonas acetoxidans]
MNSKLIIAIDGPSGAGKSTLSRLLSQQLNYINIDTGAMYRAVALAASREGIDSEDCQGLEALCHRIEIHFQRDNGHESVWLNGEDVSEAIRTPQMSLLTSKIAACAEVRQAMVRLQRQMGKAGGVVLEGRDIGSVVFPQAEVKFYLEASAQARGQRRYDELVAKGLEVDLQQTIHEVEARDAADSAREHAPLLRPEDAVAIDSTALTIDQVLEKMMVVVSQRLEQRA